MLKFDVSKNWNCCQETPECTLRRCTGQVQFSLCLREAFFAFRLSVLGTGEVVANKWPIARGKRSHGSLRRGQQERRRERCNGIHHNIPTVDLARRLYRPRCVLQESRLAWLIVAKQRRVQSARMYFRWCAMRFVCSFPCTWKSRSCFSRRDLEVCSIFFSLNAIAILRIS